MDKLKIISDFELAAQHGRELVASHIKKLKLPPFFSDKISDIENNKHGDEVFMVYPHFFSNAFAFHFDQNILDKISLISHFYYRSVLIIDDLIDNDRNGKAHTIFAGYFFREEAIKLIAEIFETKSEVWHFLSKRGLAYMNEECHERKKIDHIADYEKMASEKAALSRFPIDLLYFLSGEKFKVEYGDLLDANDSYMIALQIRDDIQDIVEDWNNGQINLAILQTLKFLAREGIDISDFSGHDLQKYFYCSNVWSELFEMHLFYLNKCMKYASKYKLSIWRDVLNSLFQETQLIEAERNSYLSEIKHGL